MPKGTFRRSVTMAGPAGERGVTDGPRPRGERSEAELGDCWAEDGDRRRVHGRREMLWRGVVGHERGAATNKLGGREEREFAGGVQRATGYGPRATGKNLVGEDRIVP